MSQSVVESQVSDESLVAQATDEFMEAVRRGETPDIDEFIRRYPSIAPVLREVLGALALLRSEEFTLASAGDSEPSDSTTAAPLGDYRIRREIGRGGMGVVYEAEQLSLGRRVALKVLPFAAALDPRHLQRFKTEAQAAAQLQHQNIVPVYAVGCERGVHYYAMQYIDGHPLSAVIADLRTNLKFDDAGEESKQTGHYHRPSGLEATVLQSPRDSFGTNASAETDDAVAVDTAKPSAGVSTDASIRSREYFRSVARLGIQAADGLEHAHGFGIVHRDVKPGNLLLDAHANLWITDFGLAQVQADSRLTMSGDILGTLRYMSPEQALRQPGLVDHRTDVYSLGVTLYELLTLEPAFGGDDRRQLLRQIAFEEPLAPRKRNPAIPHDLETIVLKAMAKSPAERYGSAKDLRDDLQRYLNDEPILARRPTVLKRLGKWSRRHRAVSATFVVSLFVALSGIVGVLAVKNTEIHSQMAETEQEWNRAESEKRKAQQALKEVQRARDDLEYRLYLYRITLAHHELQANDVIRARQLLNDCPAALRNWEWHYLNRVCHSASIVVRHSGRLFKVAFSPDGKRIVMGGAGRPWGEGKLVVRDTATGRPILVRKRPDEERNITGLAFHSDGRTVIYTAQDRSVRYWDTKTGAVKTVVRDLKGRTSGVAVSRDGSRLCVITYRGAVHMFDAHTFALQFSRPFTNLYPACVTFSPDGSRIAIATSVGTIVLDAKTGGPLHAMSSGRVSAKRTPIFVRDLSFDTDGRHLAIAKANGTIEVWELAGEGRQRLRLSLAGHVGDVRCVAFRPDGRQLASAGMDRSVRIWDSASGREVAVLRGHTDGVTALAYNAEGTRLLTGGLDRTARLWNARPASSRSVVPNRAAPFVVFDLRGDLVAGFDRAGFAEVRDVRAQAVGARPIPKGSSPVLAAAFHPVSGEVAIARKGGDVQLMNPRTLTVVRKIGTTRTPCFKLAFSPDGVQLAGATTHNPIPHWNLAGGGPARMLSGLRGRSWSIAFNRDGSRIACGGDFKEKGRKYGEVLVWDTATGMRLHVFTIPDGTAHQIVFIPASQWLAAAAGTRISILDLKSGRLVRTLTGHGRPVLGLDAHPNGRRLVSSAQDGTIKLWDVKSGHEILTLRGQGEFDVRAVRFTADGQLLLSGGGDSMIRIWDARPLKAAKR